MTKKKWYHSFYFTDGICWTCEY